MASVSDGSSGRSTFGELATDALRYWEPRRLLYNLALAAVVVGHFVAGWPGSRSILTRDGLMGLFALAVIANILYCAAYAVDLFVQFSGLRGTWPRRRWILLATGTAFAAVLTHFICSGLFSGGRVS